MVLSVHSIRSIMPPYLISVILVDKIWSVLIPGTTGTPPLPSTPSPPPTGSQSAQPINPSQAVVHQPNQQMAISRHTSRLCAIYTRDLLQFLPREDVGRLQQVSSAMDEAVAGATPSQLPRQDGGWLSMRMVSGEFQQRTDSLSTQR